MAPHLIAKYLRNTIALKTCVDYFPTKFPTYNFSINPLFSPNTNQFTYILDALNPKRPLFVRRTNGILGTYRLNFCYDFLKHLLKIEKVISFMGIYIFFQFVPENKSYAQISSKKERRSHK